MCIRDRDYSTACDKLISLGLAPSELAEKSVVTRGDMAILLYRAMRSPEGGSIGVGDAAAGEAGENIPQDGTGSSASGRQGITYNTDGSINIPVSYTHLRAADPYWGVAGQREAGAHPSVCPGLWTAPTFEAVSYTHLDVYKRQVLGHRCGEGELDIAGLALHAVGGIEDLEGPGIAVRGVLCGDGGDLVVVGIHDLRALRHTVRVGEG